MHSLCVIPASLRHVVVVVVVVVVLLMYLPAAVWGLVSESLAIRTHCDEIKFSSTALAADKSRRRLWLFI